MTTSLTPLTLENLAKIPNGDEILCYVSNETNSGIVARNTVSSVMDMLKEKKKMYPKMTHFCKVEHKPLQQIIERLEELVKDSCDYYVEVLDERGKIIEKGPLDYRNNAVCLYVGVGNYIRVDSMEGAAEIEIQEV